MSQQNPRNPDGSSSVEMAWWEIVLALLYIAALVIAPLYFFGHLCFVLGQCQ
jgi:hypothetical protein